MNYIILCIGHHLKGFITYQELQNMPLPELYEINNNLGRILQKGNESG